MIRRCFFKSPILHTGVSHLEAFRNLRGGCVSGDGLSPGTYTAEGFEIVGLYWHFIDVVWVFLFAFFYLL